MIHTNRTLIVLASTLGLALGLFGCSSSDGDGGGGTGGTGGADTVLRIMVTNDDGVDAPGIDALVEALILDERNEVVVSAPDSNRSGSGDLTGCGTGEGVESETASGYDENVWAVDGCPADAVLYGLANLYPDEPPHVVLSGINEGQNVGFVQPGGILSQISGTVGAAKTAACSGVPAIASSQGSVEEGGTVDFPSGVAAVLALLEESRSALLAGTVSLDDIISINIPSCDGEGEIRGVLEVPLATENPNGYLLNGPQDCTSTSDEVPNDVEGYFNGYTVISPVPSNSNETCDKLAE